MPSSIFHLDVVGYPSCKHSGTIGQLQHLRRSMNRSRYTGASGNHRMGRSIPFRLRAYCMLALCVLTGCSVNTGTASQMHAVPSTGPVSASSATTVPQIVTMLPLVAKPTNAIHTVFVIMMENHNW